MAVRHLLDFTKVKDPVLRDALRKIADVVQLGAVSAVVSGTAIDVATVNGVATVTNKGVTSLTATTPLSAPTTTGDVSLSLGVVPISLGGHGQTTKAAGFDALSPASTKGDLIAHDGTNNVRVAGNTSSAKKLLMQTGTGTVSALPAWDEPISSDVIAWLGYTPEDTAAKNQPSGYAGLDSSGILLASQLPPISITDTFVVGSQAAMLALTCETGDVAVRTDLSKSYILAGSDPTVLADWQELLTPTGAVTSVNGYMGSVVLTTSDVGEGSNLYHTSARADSRVQAAKGAATPLNLGTAAAGTGATWAPIDHVHPGQDVQTSATPIFAGLTATGPILGKATTFTSLELSPASGTAKSRIGNDAASMSLSFNAYYDGVGWQRDDTGTDAYSFVQHTTNQRWEWRYAAAGSNPISTFGSPIATLSKAGLLNTVAGYQVNGTTVIDSSRKAINLASVAVGVASTTFLFDAQATGGGNVASTGFGGASGVIVRYANGTQGSPTAAASGDSLGQFGFRGYHSSSAFPTNSTATIQGTAAENFTSSAQGTHLDLYSTPTGSVTRAVGLRVAADGSTIVAGAFKMGTTASPTTVIDSSRNLMNIGTIASSGAITVTKTAQAGAAEILQTWQVSDDSTAKLQVASQTSTDGRFIPELYWVGSNANHAGVMQFVGDADTGSNAICMLNFAYGSVTGGVNTRPLAEFRNGNGAYMTWNPLNITMAAGIGLYTAASVTANSGFRLPHGTAPTSPVNGDMWTTSSGLFVRINGVTKSVNLT